MASIGCSEGSASTQNYVTAVAETVGGLIKAYEAQIPVNLSKLKTDMAKKYKLAYIPKLVDIIAAVPEDYRCKLLPYIKAKPVRTASGVAVVAVMSKPHRYLRTFKNSSTLNTLRWLIPRVFYIFLQ